MINNQIKKVFDDILIDALKRRHALQGHTLTGALEDSIESDYNEATKTVDYFALGYAEYTNTGIPASIVNSKMYNAGSGSKVKSKYILALMEYARVRFKLTDEKKQKSAAFAIAYKHRQEGIPTKDSSYYSNDKGKARTRWIDMTLEDKQVEIEFALFDVIDKLISLEITNFVNEAQYSENQLNAK